MHSVYHNNNNNNNTLCEETTKASEVFANLLRERSWSRITSSYPSPTRPRRIVILPLGSVGDGVAGGG